MTIKSLGLTKRHRFIVASLVVFGISLVFQSLISAFGVPAILVLCVALYAITYLALWENISGIEYITLFILPISFIIGINLFITILPERNLFRYPFYAITPVGMYIILLTENIFNVAAIRTIQLLRAAHAVSYIVTLLTAFFLLSYIISMHYDIITSSLLVTLTIAPLTLQFLWSFDLLSQFTKRTIVYISIISLVVAQINIFIHFYQQIISMTSVFLVAVYYVLLGIVQHYYENKLTRKPILEYAIVAIIIFVIMVITTSWQG